MAAIHFNARTKNALIWGGVGLTLVFLYLVSGIVTPFIWALVTAFILNAVVGFATRRIGGPRSLWVVVIYFGLVAALIWGLTVAIPLLIAQVRQLADAAPTYLQQVQDFFQTNRLLVGSTSLSAAQISAALRQVPDDLIGGLRSRAPELARDIAERLLNLLLYLIASFYFLLNADRIVANIRGLFSSPVLAELDPWFKRVNATLGSYLRGQIFLILIVSVATFVGLSILGVRFAVVLALMSGIVETVPYLGPYAAGAVATLVAMTQPPPNNFGWPPLILGVAVAVMYTIIRQVEDNLIMPFVIGRTVELHPLTVLFVVLAGASLAGVLGLLLAVPVAATIKIILEFLWQKIREPDPREALVVGPATTWEKLGRRLRSVPGKRLLLVIPRGAETPALADVGAYRRLLLLAGELGVDLQVLTNDARAAATAQAAGIVVDEQPAEQFARTTAAANGAPATPADDDLPPVDALRDVGPRTEQPVPGRS
ncbi:MAG TPA: AI-2E family transporter [Chloroflexia bacterium]|nr:AI-2E family transporter [Chloroflexia bacterium]